jgi:hypothetical protein
VNGKAETLKAETLKAEIKAGSGALRGRSARMVLIVEGGELTRPP